MSNHELESRIRELRELQALIEEAEAEAEAVKDTLKAHMGDTEELRAGAYKVMWTPVKTARLDTKALKKAMPDIYGAFTREGTTRRFCIV